MAIAQLLMITFEGNDECIYCDIEEYREICESLNYLGIEHTDYFVEEKIYRITWYDDIDEEWSDIWSTEADYEKWINEVKEAEVEYQVREYN